MTNEHEAFWAGEFGDAYLERNQVRWQDRIPFWQRIHALTRAETALELGCNAGWNMLALRAACPDIKMLGLDVNEAAVQAALKADLIALRGPATEPGQLWKDGAFDLVFTVGVLIHIPPQELQELMQSNITASRRYVLAVEYEADQETELAYRGHTGRLWKRPYGEIYEQMGMRLVAAGDPGPAFDRCHYWLMRKP